MSEAAAPTPAETDPAELEAGRLLFARECRFVMGGVALKDLPDSSQTEIAFCGRSNVGKSSLVNALTGRTTLARTSVTPGRTQQLNFFDLSGRLMLVDLPGHGYAKAPKSLVDGWNKLVRGYLRGRPTLRRVCFLIDARHGIKEVDQAVMKLLDETAVVFQVVLTKADKVKAAELAEVTERTLKEAKAHLAAHPEIAVTSSHTGLGIPELRATLARLAAGG